jgi:hypothetical protein
VEKNTQQGTLCSVLLNKYSDDQIKKTVMGGACNMYGEGEVHSGF